MADSPNSNPELPDRRGGAEPITYRRFSAGRWRLVHSALSRESAVTVFLDRRELVTILCTPVRVNYLVLGFLANEGVIDDLDDVAMLRVCDEEATVDVRLNRPAPALWEHRTLTSGCGGAMSIADVTSDIAPVDSSLVVTPDRILLLMKKLQGASALFRQAGGVHAAALAEGDDLVAVAEDVGRHNTVDKIRGQCMLEGRPTAGRVLLATGRLSSEIVIKGAKMRVPILVSRNSPTARAVALAEELRMTLVGYARGESITVYSARERVSGAG